MQGLIIVLISFRAKTIKNKATKNVEQSAAELKILLEKAYAEIARLKSEKGIPSFFLVLLFK